MNQLTREDNYLLDKTYIFTYDTAGNILSKKTYNTVLTTENGTPDSIINYTYASTGWKDQLVSFGGETITYDVLGNPTTYRGHNLTWGKLRQLNSFDSNTFTYNAEGIRTSKNNITYTLDGSKILAETRPTGTIKYLYGINSVIGFTYNGNTYYYEKNIQGDVTAIVDTTGTIKAKYVYDAWGNHTITLDTDGIGTLNPFRYRSYYFDTETGLYYLQSRYYDPITCRFINADNNFSNWNLYMYCQNNPIVALDANGKHWYYLGLDDLLQGVDKLMASTSNIVYGRAAIQKSFYDPHSAKNLYNSRPFQDTTPSLEMQIFTEIMYNTDWVVDLSVSIDIPKINAYFKIGISKVMSANKRINSTYVHAGVGTSTKSILPASISYSIGIVQGLVDSNSYAGPFFNFGGSSVYGFDYGSWHNGASSYSLSISNSYGVYTGIDYYWCID